MNYRKRIADLVWKMEVFFLAAAGVLLICGFRIYRVMSGSMAPAIGTGSAVWVSDAKFEEIQEGDVITYTVGDGRTSVTHRVIGKNETDHTFFTKGDANGQADAKPVPYCNVDGVVRFWIPGAGYLLEILKSGAGKLLLAGMLFWMVLMHKAPAFCGKAPDKEEIA